MLEITTLMLDSAAVCVKEIGKIREEKPPFVSGSGV